MAVKRYSNTGGISLSGKEEENYKSDTKDDIDPDNSNDKYILKH